MKTQPNQTDAHLRPFADLSACARALPAWLERERALLAALQQEGVAESELRVLHADQQLLSILAEESLEQSAEASRHELGRVLKGHEARLTRIRGGLSLSAA